MSSFLFDENFAEAFLHRIKPYSLFGMRLYPFSFWHKVQLEWNNSRVLLGGATLWDAWQAVKICSTQYPNIAKVNGYSVPWQISWNIKNKFKSTRKVMETLYSYIDDFNSPPKYWGHGGTSKKKLAEAYNGLYEITKDQSLIPKIQKAMAEEDMATGSQRMIDDSLEQVAYYIKITASSPEKAWNMPMGELCWYNACFMVFDGNSKDIWTPFDEIRFNEHLKNRTKNIEELAKEILTEENITMNLALAKASVKYWEKVSKTIHEKEEQNKH